ncbi:MAG: App1 family protein [Actinomycetes bacterium]
MSPSDRLHRAARLEDRVFAALDRLLRRRGWTPRVLPYTGYGTDGWVRVLARVLLAPPETREREFQSGRGWRRFLSAKAVDVAVTVEVGDECHEVTTTRGGYIDTVLPAALPAGWSEARLTAEGSPVSRAPVRIVGAEERLGVVSDVDDTVLITALPRPLLAFWNTFVRQETARRPVPGMADLYRELAAAGPDTFVVYLSTGAWNVAQVLERFLARHDFPRGPLLMTDWGPTHEGWFRSGREHKRSQLRRLVDELPQLRWVLVGDDGQHDPELYDEVVAHAATQVLAVAIRQLSAAEQVLTHGTPDPPSERHGATRRALRPVPVLRAPDGRGLLRALRTTEVLRPARPPRQPR